MEFNKKELKMILTAITFIKEDMEKCALYDSVQEYRELIKRFDAILGAEENKNG